MSYQADQRYAQALFDVCEGVPSLENVRTDLKKLSELIETSAEFQVLTTNPLIPKHKQRTLIKKLFSRKLHETTLKYLNFLVNKKRLNLLGAICYAFEQFYLDAKNIAKITIYTSVDLSPRQINVLIQHLGEKLNKDVEYEVIKRPEMIGGVKVRIGDEVYDYTVRTQLEEFRESFLERAQT